MHRAVRWAQSSARHRRQIAGAAIGGSTISYVALQWQRPILADGGSFTAPWKSTPEVSPKEQALSGRVDRALQATNHTRKGSDVIEKVSSAQDPPPQTKGSVTNEESMAAVVDALPTQVLAAWQTATGQISMVSDTFTAFDFTNWRDQVAGYVVPSWLKILPGYLDKLRNELSMAPWSLSWEIWEEAHDPEIHPEICWDAKVRLSNKLCDEELAFLRKRLPHKARALARYLDVPESDINPEDVPVIGMCGSGGGLRALVAGASSYLSAADDGLFDCATYTAGVSGSCWLHALYYSSISKQNYGNIIQHLKDRIGIHIVYPPALLGLVATMPTNKYLLGGFVEKLRGNPDADFGLVDIYGLALAARLLVPHSDLRVNDYDLKVSNQRFVIDDGQQPLPIYTAVRHEIPPEVGDKADVNTTHAAKAPHLEAKHYDWFQWFEWTPYEFYCDELEAGIPTWAVGREWKDGNTAWRDNGLALPELRVPLYMGIWGSAFCATLSHYYKEIRPVLIACGMNGLDTLLTGKNTDLVKVHPVDPAVIPNFALGLRGKVPSSCPDDMLEAPLLQLMDAGMANNLPIYPLLRPGRNVDVIIAFDASADVRGDNWIHVIDGYARQRGIKAWPMGSGWPAKTMSDEKTVAQLDETERAAAAESQEDPTSIAKADQNEGSELGYCTVWAGTTEERQNDTSSPPSTRVDFLKNDEDLLPTHSGIAVIYFPFLANPKVPGVDPMRADFMSTWNFVYTPEEIDTVVSLAKANYDAGREQTKRTIRAVWEMKKAKRLQRETEEREMRKRVKMRAGPGARFRKGDFGHGDHFG